MKSHSDLIKSFEEGATHGQASNMYIEGDVLYSYGHHFPLCVRKKQNGGPYSFIVNGDKYSISTSQHQSQCFHLGPQIPFSALSEAEIDPYEINMIDQSEDQWREIPDPTPEDPDHIRREHTLGGAAFEYDNRFFLSGIDDNESWQMRAYFLCQVPREIISVEDAFDSLVPNRVKEFGAEGREFLRQGEWYLLPSDFETRHLPRPTRYNAPLEEGSTHVATELRLNSAPFARGTVRHRPGQYRTPQHGVARLGKIWHEAVKNLALASWNAAGMVD